MAIWQMSNCIPYVASPTVHHISPRPQSHSTPDFEACLPDREFNPIEKTYTIQTLATIEQCKGDTWNSRFLDKSINRQTTYQAYASNVLVSQQAQELCTCVSGTNATTHEFGWDCVGGSRTAPSYFTRGKSCGIHNVFRVIIHELEL